MKNILAIITIILTLCVQNSYALNLWQNSPWNNFKNNLLSPNYYNSWYNPWQNNYGYNRNFHNRYNNNYQGITGYSIPITNPNLNNCTSNSYYVNQYGVVECKHEINSNAAVKIIYD